MNGDCWLYGTRIGVFGIVSLNGGWHVFYEDEDLGRYQTPGLALDDLAGGHTYSPSSGVDTSTLGLPEDLSEWEFRAAR